MNSDVNLILKFTMNKQIKSVFFIFLTGIFIISLLSNCNRPDYSIIPKIRLVKFEKYFNVNSNSSRDSIVFILNFKDGDGDLGLDPSDAPTVDSRIILDFNGNKIFYNPSDNQKFNCKEWDKNEFYKIESNTNYNNLFIEIDKKINGQFVKLDNSCFPINAYRFQRLAPPNYTGPLDVNFNYVIKLDFDIESDDLASQVLVLNPSDIIRFRIRITDRKLHTSNEVVTSEVRVR
ncbi:MAG: hypothetical protein EAZ07_04195 [Cytophagales bacterium]|nr:MAG: hypothetical protein EAZ07_04195 [Cytophagales bacterium]